jgi:2-oxoglutarate ferredoxin oxidoreductase subunit gamma
MEQGILISGTGGQGIVAAGEFLSEALFRAGYEVVNTRSYGSEARGGSCRSEVIVSDSELYDLQMEKADVLIALSLPAYRRYISCVKKDGLVLADAEVVGKLGDDETRSNVDIVSVSAAEIAVGLGNPIVANMVLLGALSKRSELVELERLREAVREMMRPSMQEINLKALEAGYAQA